MPINEAGKDDGDQLSGGDGFMRENIGLMPVDYGVGAFGWRKAKWKKSRKK